MKKKRKPKTITDRCTGHCCQMFTIPYSPDELWSTYRRWLTGGEPITMNGNDPQPIAQDIHLIAPMVVHQGYLEVALMPSINPGDDQLLGKDLGRAHYYSCKHFDAKQKICTIYEQRPAMCRAYPNGKLCNYKGCTWISQKAKKETAKERSGRLRVLQDKGPQTLKRAKVADV